MAIETNWDEWNPLDLILDERLSSFVRYAKNFVLTGFGLSNGPGLQIVIGTPGLNIAYINGYEYKQLNAVTRALNPNTTNYVYLSFTKTPDPVGGTSSINLFAVVNQTGIPPSNSMKLGEVDTDGVGVIDVREENNHFHLADSQFDTDLEGNHHQITELVLHSGSVFPLNPTPGQVFYHSTQLGVFFWDGFGWQSTGGISVKLGCRALTLTPLPACTYNNGVAGVGATLTGNAFGALPAQDGVTLNQDERLLVKDQVAGEQNGIYKLIQVGDAFTPFILQRTTDADSSTSNPPKVGWGLFTFIGEGTLAADTGWILTTDQPIVMGTTPLVFAQFTGLGEVTTGAGLSKVFNQIDVELSPVPGLEFDAPGVNGRLQAKVNPNGSIERVASGLGVVPDPNGGLATTVTGLKVVPVNTSINVSASGVKSSVPTIQNKDQAPAVTAGDNQTTGLTIAGTPGAGSYIRVSVNGLAVKLGDGVKTKDAYFSADGGVTARAFSAIVAGDTLYWNGVIAGFNLAVSDSVDMEYDLP